jgi:hypothetical protein
MVSNLTALPGQVVDVGTFNAVDRQRVDEVSLTSTE